MLSHMYRHLLLLSAAAVLGSCGGGGGGGGGGGAPADLTGTWFGTHEDVALGLHTISVTINGSNITSIVIGGTPTGQTGTVAFRSGQIWGYDLSDGTSGGFFLDSSATHAAFADDSGAFGVLQKGATSHPTYSVNDINGAWSGVSVETDFNTFTQVNSSATCNMANATDCVVTSPAGTSNVVFGGTFSSTFGRWQGTYNMGGITGSVNAFLSPDKTFGAAWGCDNPNQTWPDDCAFSAWRR